MPFGLCNAGNTFQHLIDQVLGDLPFCFVYMDDILIFSKNLSSHVDHLCEVFLLCRQHGLTKGLPKCEFSVSKIKFLVHLLPANGCLLLTKHSAAISAFPTPSDKPALQRFPGMINLNRKFLRSAARVLAPLTDALKGPGPLFWTPPLPDTRICSLLFQNSSILFLMIWCLWQWIPLMLILVQFSSSSWTVLGLRYPSTPGSYLMQRRNTPPTTMSF